jgi:hypothetical protein
VGISDIQKTKEKTKVQALSLAEGREYLLLNATALLLLLHYL